MQNIERVEFDDQGFALPGDTHAAQGDGEVCGTAIESPMDVVLTLDLVKGANLKTPRFTTPGPVTRHLDAKGYEVTTGVGPDLMAPGAGNRRILVENLPAARLRSWSNNPTG